MFCYVWQWTEILMLLTILYSHNFLTPATFQAPLQCIKRIFITVQPINQLKCGKMELTVQPKSMFSTLTLRPLFCFHVQSSRWARSAQNGYILTSACPIISSAHVFHCGHLSLSSNVVSFEPQQHCSWLNHKALRQMPSFKSVIQSAAMSINPASAPVGETGLN